MKEVYEEFNWICGILDSLDLTLQQKRCFIERWAKKDEVPFRVADGLDNEPLISILLPKDKALEAFDEKIRYHEEELEKHKVAAVKAMQRLIEEWTSTK